MAYVVLHSEGKTMKEVVEILPEHKPGAIEISEKLLEKFTLAIREVLELEETLRTGLPKKVRGR